VGSPIKILLAEDEFLIALTLKVQLEAMGYQVVATPQDGIKAVALTKQLRPDVVLMDIGMPGMDGITATQAIMKEAPTPVVMLTAYNDRARMAQAVQAGAVGYVFKPVVDAQLRAAILEALAVSQSATP